MLALLLALQIFHVAFLALHDWIPLGRLNDVRAVTKENPRGKLLIGTAITTSLCLCRHSLKGFGMSMARGRLGVDLAVGGLWTAVCR